MIRNKLSDVWVALIQFLPSLTSPRPQLYNTVARVPTVCINGVSSGEEEEGGTVLTEAQCKKLEECWIRKGTNKMKQWREKHYSLEGHFLFSGRKASSVLRLSRCGSSLWNLLNRRPSSWFSLSGPVSQPALDPPSLCSSIQIMPYYLGILFTFYWRLESFLPQIQEVRRV